MGHDHIVSDDDLQFTIDPSTRLIDNQSGSSFSLMQADHNSELFTFELPRMIEGHDMLECDVVQVHYTNTGTGTSASVRGVNQGLIELTDLRVNPENEDTLICTWLLSQEATQLAGTLKFQLKFKCRDTEDSTKFSYIWSTRSYEGITIIAGINNSEAVVTEYADILEQWREVLFGIEIISIVDIQKTSSSGYVDTYTITMTDGSTSTFAVTNGTDGLDVASVKKTASEGLVDTYTITMSDGSLHTFTVTNGEAGAGIVNVEKTSTEDLVDTYTITMSDGSTATFTVTNGKDAPLNHTHSTADITDFPETMPPSEHTHLKAEITDFPETMPPSEHTHLKAEITDFPETMPPSEHTHLKAEITDFPETMPPSEHTHEELKVLQEAINRNSSAIVNLQHGVIEPVGEFETDSSVAYVKDVPENALPYAEVKKVGGMTRKTANLAQPGNDLQNWGCSTSIASDGKITLTATDAYPSIFSRVARILLKANTEYTISLQDRQNVQYGFLWEVDSTQAVGGALYTEITYTPSKDEYVDVAVYMPDNSTVGTVTSFYLMVNEGSTALPYEPYFEGLRSALVTEVESVGANLFDKSKVTGVTQTETGFSFTNTGILGSPVSIGKLKTIAPNLKVGDNITFYASVTNTPYAIAFLYFSGSGTDWPSGTFHVVTEIELENAVFAYGYTNVVCEYSNVIFTKVADTPYTPYLHHTLPIPIEVRGSMNIFGGLAFANRIKEVNPDAEVDTSAKTVSYYAPDMVGKFLFTNFKPNIRYTFIIRGLGSSGRPNIAIRYTDGTEESFPFAASNTVGTIVRVSNEERSVESLIGFYSEGSSTLYYEECGIFEGVLNESDFDPYGITGLDGYGLGVSDTVHNYIDWENKTFVKMCGKAVDLGALDWTVVDGENYAYSMSIRNSVKQFGTILHSGLPTGIKTMNIDSASAMVVIFNNATFSVDSLKAAMSGVMLVYELATPEVTDISDLITEDNFIGVEGNGTLTFKNTYEYAVPSEVEYQMEV